jgi:hypothetical protein
LFLESETKEIGLFPICSKEFLYRHGSDLFKRGFQKVNSGLEAVQKERWNGGAVGNIKISY